MEILALYDEILAEILADILSSISAAEIPLETDALYRRNVKSLIGKNIQRKNLLLLRLISRRFKEIFDSIVLPAGRFHFLLKNKNIFLTSIRTFKTDTTKHICIVDFNEFLNLHFNPDDKYFIHLGFYFKNGGISIEIVFLLFILGELTIDYRLEIENDKFCTAIIDYKNKNYHLITEEYETDKNKLLIKYFDPKNKLLIDYFDPKNMILGRLNKDTFQSDINNSKINFIKEFLNSHHAKNIPHFDNFTYKENKLFDIYEEFLIEEISNKKDLLGKKITKDTYEYYVFLSTEMVKKMLL